MIHEYIITAFKVIVGVITENRLALSALVALGILLVWMLFSIIFSFQGKFASNVRRINEFVSRNGIGENAKPGLELLISKMPSEFQRGYRKFEKNPNKMPSDYIKRFESLDMELSGGVFNQNKSVLKTFIHFVFCGLSLFSLAVLPIDEALTGYSLAQALIIPLIFFVVSKVMYYIYTATRQYQYKSAVEEFNYMIENFDRAAMDNLGQTEKVQNAFNYDVVEPSYPVKVENKEPVIINEPEMPSENELLEHESVQETDFALKQDEVKEELEQPEEIQESLETNEKQQAEIKVEETKDNVLEEQSHLDNVKPNLDEHLEGEEVVEEKRGRGRPRKEVNPTGEFVITNDKEFEEALVRAEKLMRKNEEPLSASQTKRIEKQIKELVDAMTKYKEGK